MWEGGFRVPYLVRWPGHIQAASFCDETISLAPVLLGQRGDDQPVRQTLLVQSSPGRDAFIEQEPELPKLDAGAPRRTTQERQAVQNKAWNEIAKKGVNSSSDGMAHALREGPWKLVFDIEHDQPVAIYYCGKAAFACPASSNGPRA